LYLPVTQQESKNPLQAPKEWFVMFKEIRQSKITQKIIDQIRTAILEGKLKPGDKLPSEKEMVALFQVSKQTLRESMRALEHTGMIRMRKGIGGGAFIVEVDIDVTKDSLANYLYFKNMTVNDLSEFRKLIEPYAAYKAAQIITPAELEELKTLNSSAREHLNNGDAQAARRDEIEFHRFIANLTQNPLIILMLDFAEGLLDDFKNIVKPDISFFKEVLDSHERIYNAISCGDAQLAYDEMMAHVVEVGDHLIQLKEGFDLGRVYTSTG
jgi:GntR family transcriptional repressor for pyruvate dehydrogenase complex